MLSGRRYKVATFRGIPLYVGASWLWIAAMYLYIQYINISRSQWAPSEPEAVGLALFGSVLFFGGVLVHEASHAVVARAFDLPVSGITLVFWGGATETRSNGRGPLAEFLIAGVGPASTLALSGVFFLVSDAMDPGLARAIVKDLAILNLWFAGFNALPGFPLDGGRMLLATAWGLTKKRQTAVQVAAYVGIVIGVLFMAGAAFLLFEGNIGSGFFLGYIGSILTGSGRAISKRRPLMEQLATGRVEEAMHAPPDAIPATTSLSQALDRWLRDNPSRSFPVVENGKVIGTVSISSARRVGGRDPLRPVRDGMAPLMRTPVLSPSDRLDDALEWLGGNEGLVLRDGALVGALGGTDIERWYQARFGGAPATSDAEAPPRPDM